MSEEMREHQQGQQKQTQEIDPQKIEQFISKVINDLGATSNVALAFIGDKLGLYKAMAQTNNKNSNAAAGLTSQELASLTSTNERYVREWLAEQVCGGYITYDSKTDRYSLPKEHAIVLTDESSPAYIPGVFQLIMSALRTEPKVSEAFRTGRGFSWTDHELGVFEGQARFSTPIYKANLITSWIPSLDAVEEKLKQDGGNGGSGSHHSAAKVADIGCGYGASTIILAKAYPNSTFYGFDYHAQSIESARKQAEREGLSNDRIKFEVASSTDFPGPTDFTDRGDAGYDLITFFDCFHDMSDPYAVARHVKDMLKPDGTCMIVEVASNDKLEENIASPLARVGYAGSIFVCIPTALAKRSTTAEGGSGGVSTYEASSKTADNILPLGAMPGISKIEKIMKESGFSKFRCTFNNGFNMVLEARP
jgi:2-polyprenyl-3-methyl-5-hydroxy-6-metoxy-1,4-benzoquinol methylase